MKHLAIAMAVFLITACSKKDFQAFKDYQKRNKCAASSINAGKQNTDDFFVIRTFGSNGIVTHLRMQVRDIYGTVFLFDYGIAYATNKAIFHGSTRAYNWILDNPPSEDSGEPEDPNAPKHPEEILELKDTRDFQILLERKTHYPVEVQYVQNKQSVLKLAYDQSGHLSHVGSFNVTTDSRGNILSILTPPLVEEEPYYGPQQLGVTYYYGTRNHEKGTNQYYETPNIFIHPMYSIIEVLNWGPFQPTLERTAASVQYTYGEEYLPDPTLSMSYSNHRYDARGNLIGYDFEGDVRRALPYPASRDVRQLTRSVEWECDDHRPGPLK